MTMGAASDVMNLRVVGVESLEGLEEHAEPWNRLAASLPQNLPMLTYAWQRTVIEQQVAPAHPWIALFAYDAGSDDLVGVLTAALEDARVGVIARAPLYYHTDDGDVVLRPDRASEALGLLLAELRRRVPRLRCVELGGVREDSPTRAAVARGTPGFVAASEPTVKGSSFRIEGDADDWFRGLSKNLRSDLKRSANRARKDDLGEAEITFLEGADATPDLLDDLMKIEASGWKAEHGNAMERHAGTEAKYRALAQRFADAGMLEWHRLVLGGRLAAAHMAVRMGNDLMLLRQGLEQELARYGPGNHLIRAMVEREYERGGGEINLVTDYPWCRRWRMDLTPYHRVRLAPAQPLPWLTSVLPARARNLLRRTPGVRRLVRWVQSRRNAGARPPKSR